MNFYERVGRVTLIVIGLLIAIPIGLLVVWSIVGDASMLTDTMAWWGLLLFVVTPAAVALFNWRAIREWWQDRRGF